ncbi:DUF2894 domain-containing protein [Paraburkholderia kirstenboschensis]|uniref:DUF2894 domain-containing protein n=1 Tax=Paraburkholderia kirstenboschensis TaxID=1245436 RepID=A0ABZ0EJ81_9BURK|nr:DUF2894 domain-containing protein [Paraburkholderia kirstenboschensis]WOD17268.1 DUF2894 domain-containing protein [Paraburkholderia kirstenboschensis]
MQSPRATLDAWRESGADRLDPLRFAFIDALERRAAAHTGAARHVLDEKLAVLLETYARKVGHAAATAGHASSANEPARGALAELVGYMQNEPRHREGDRAPYPELLALDYFRETWAKVRTEKQLRQSLQPAPGNAGPLNSSSLVHRSLSLMRELSPGYLKQFLSYVDALSWMEQLSGGAPASKDAPRAGAAAKGTRNKAR